MNWPEEPVDDRHARSLRRALAGCDAGGADALLLARIRGRGPAELAEAHRIGSLKAVTAAAAALLLVLVALTGVTENDEPVTESLPLATLEEDGYGTYSRVEVVLEELLIGEVSQ